MKTALAGTATTKFTDMMEAVFGIDENDEDIPEVTPTAPEEEEEVPESMYATLGETIEEEAPSTSAGKRSSSGKKPVAKKQKRKGSVPAKSGPFPIQDATVIYPSKADQKRGYLHTGVDDCYIKDRNSGPFAKASIYACNYARHLREQGKNPTECDELTQNRGQCSTHVRRQHLNICIGCYICGRRWWSAGTWKEHMKGNHKDVENVWFVENEGVVGSIKIKKEYVPAANEDEDVILDD